MKTAHEPFSPGVDLRQLPEADREASDQPPQQQVQLHRGLRREHPQEHRAVRQTQPALLQPRPLHQGRHRIKRDLLLELLRTRQEDRRGQIYAKKNHISFSLEDSAGLLCKIAALHVTSLFFKSCGFFLQMSFQDAL